MSLVSTVRPSRTESFAATVTSTIEATPSPEPTKTPRASATPLPDEFYCDDLNYSLFETTLEINGSSEVSKECMSIYLRPPPRPEDALLWPSIGPIPPPTGVSFLTEIVIEDGITAIDDEAFIYQSSLTTVSLPSTIVAIRDRASAVCSSLSHITLNPGLTSIGENAFLGSGLIAIAIPASVTSIGNGAFATSPLNSITVANDNSVFESYNNVLFTLGKTSLVCYPGGLTDPTYTTPSQTSSIWSLSFAFAEHLGEVTISDSVTTFGDSAFGWSQIANISIRGSIDPGNFFNNAPIFDSISVRGQINQPLCTILNSLFQVSDPPILWLDTNHCHSGDLV
jgi:hypothetical protein